MWPSLPTQLHLDFISGNRERELRAPGRTARRLTLPALLREVLPAIGNGSGWWRPESKGGTRGSFGTVSKRQRLYRSRSHRLLAGVCGGLAEFFGLNPTLVRIGFALFGLFGVGEVAYLLLWLIVPKEPR